MKIRPNIPERAYTILSLFFFCFLLIASRIWYLAVFKHEEYQAIARKPQIRILTEEAPRGTIRDRFNTPLAVNKIDYTISLTYEPIKRLPAFTWKRDQTGKRIKIPYRKNYLTSLIAFLEKELNMNPRDLEDMINSRAALFPNTPQLLKEGLSEEQYYRLHAREKDWPGLVLQLRPKRHYPKGMVAGPILGYMGMIQEKQLETIQQELITLERYLKDRACGIPTPLPKGYFSSLAVKERFQELKEKSYSLRSFIGKAGIEGKFDDQLRGSIGKKKVEIDSKGRVLRPLPDSSSPLSGRRILLTLSSELQEYAEELLISHETARHIRFPSAGKNHHLIPSPWIKGGAIVAILPHTGEIVALASHPRYSPADFVEKNRDNINKWLETTTYIGDIWDGIRPLERELLGENTSFPQKQYLSLDLYLHTILSLTSPIRSALDTIKNLKTAILLLQELDFFYELSGEKTIHPLIDALFFSNEHIGTFYKTSKEKITALREKLPQPSPLFSLLSPIPHNDDKILCLDILRLIVPHDLFTETLLEEPLEQTLATYRSHSQIVAIAKRKVRADLKKQFHEDEFQQWRTSYFDLFLKQKRKEEKGENRYPRPYLDYLEGQEEKLFELFFRKNKEKALIAFLSSDPSAKPLFEYINTLEPQNVIEYIHTLRSFEDLQRPLLGKYYFPFGGGKEPQEWALARHFYPSPGFGYARSKAYQETAPLGSIFKLVTGYEAVKQQYGEGENGLNPLTVFDQSPSYQDKITSNTVLGYTSSGIPITRSYKGGRLPRGHPNIGKIDLPAALERSSNLYFSLLAADRIRNPRDLLATAQKLGLGRKNNLDLPQEAKGTIPSDLWNNPTSLYSFAIGQHSLTVSPLQTALLLSTFANNGKNIKPQIIRTIANLEPSEERTAFFNKTSFSYKDLFSMIGIYFPLFPIAEDQEALPYLKKPSPEVLDEIYLPTSIRDFLFSGLHDVVNGTKGTARPEIIRSLKEMPVARKTYYEIAPFLIGKTSTAEIAYRPSLERGFDPIIAKHIWFAGVSFEDPLSYDTPELIVVVFLRYGDHGKEAAPLAAQIIKKWREIKGRTEERENSVH